MTGKLVHLPGKQGRGGDHSERGPAAVVMSHDDLYGPDGIDRPRWAETVFFPLVLICEAGTVVIEERETFMAHLEEVPTAGRAEGTAGLCTRILSEIHPAENMAVLGSFRDWLDADGNLLASASITSSLTRTGGAWRINQIHFNDSRQDPSVVSHVLHDTGDKE